jgi:hypothetical protein
MISRLFITATALLLSLVITAQEKINIDNRIADAFGQKQVSEWQQNNPEKLLFYSVLLKEGVFVQEYGKEKIMANLDVIPLIKLKPQFSSEILPDISKGADSFNILKFDFNLDKEKMTVCRIDESGFVIVLSSIKDIENKANSFTLNK